MKTKILALSILFFMAAYGSTFAQTGRHAIEKRHAIHQQKRIRHGVKKGELTHREKAHLKRREARIHHDKKIARADGRVTRREKAKIHHEQKRTSRAIYRQKHDRQTRR